MNQSWIKEAHSFKDYCTEVFYDGATTNNDEFYHDTTGLPVVFQGQENSCVACSITFIQQWIEKNHPNLSHEWLSQISNTGPDGAKPKSVLEAARTIGICTQTVWDTDRDSGYLDAGQHRIAGYAKSSKLKLAHLGYLIEQCPIMVGVDNFMGKGPHMMVAVGFNLSKNVVKCANWWRLDRQDFVEFDASNISFACSILVDKPVDKPTMKILDVLKDKLSFIPKKLKLGIAAFGVALLAFVGGFSGEQMFGAGYAPITGYSSRTTSYVSAVATTIPVASTKDKAGNQITLANVSPSSTVRIYMNLEAGTAREELIACTGVTSVSWTNCIRGLTFQGSSTAASSTLAKAHNSGSNIIISNTGQFYGEYLTVDGAQNIYGGKVFYTYPMMATGLANPTFAGQLATKNYVDTVGAGGFTAVNVSTTRGLSVDGSVPEKVGIRLTSGYGLRFLGNGSLVLATTTSLTFSNINGTSTSFRLNFTPSNNYDGVNLGYFNSNTPSSTLMYFGDGSDGASTTAASFTLTRDYYFTNYIVATGTVINSGGYRIYASNSLKVRGKLHNDGGNGGNCTLGVSGGTAGATSSRGTLGWGSGGNSGVNCPTNGTVVNGKNGTNLSTTIGSRGGAGGSCQNAAGTGSAGAAGTLTSAKSLPVPLGLADLMVETGSSINIFNGGSGGGSGGCADSSNSSCSGGSGAGGGIIFISAKSIDVSGTLSAIGGNAGTSACLNSTASAGGSGGGGGGYIYLRYITKTGSGTVSVAGGNGSSGCNLGGTSGNNGSNGTAGTLKLVDVQ